MIKKFKQFESVSRISRIGNIVNSSELIAFADWIGTQQIRFSNKAGLPCWTYNYIPIATEDLVANIFMKDNKLEHVDMCINFAHFILSHQFTKKTTGHPNKIGMWYSNYYPLEIGYITTQQLYDLFKSNKL